MKKFIFTCIMAVSFLLSSQSMAQYDQELFKKYNSITDCLYDYGVTPQVVKQRRKGNWKRSISYEIAIFNKISLCRDVLTVKNVE